MSFEEKIVQSTRTEKEKLIIVAIDILRGLGYGSFVQSQAAKQIRDIPDRQIHEFYVHIKEVIT